MLSPGDLLFPRTIPERDLRRRHQKSTPSGFSAGGLCCKVSDVRDQKLRWARTFRKTVLWSLNSYTVVGLGAVAARVAAPVNF